MVAEVLESGCEKETVGVRRRAERRMDWQQVSVRLCAGCGNISG